ncbi:MAG: nucleotide excision repair endonuclease [Verrucomicrobia bacterium]|nr:nucleotide excision repair endonuclease [Verrucomicrobiota bacterium]
MAVGQQWLFAPACPLVDRLGREFFRRTPAHPGVYVMRDARGAVVYVGKAKNLRDRLGSYRVANPERVSRRHLRLMREVVRIDVELCSNESAALVREATLIREFKPRFNRAGVWPGRARFLTWRLGGGTAQFCVHEIPPLGWERFGSLGGYARRLLGSVVRLVWVALHPQAGFSALPEGWAHGRFALPVTVGCGGRTSELQAALGELFWGQAEAFGAWVRGCTEGRLPAFDEAAMRVDVEEVESFAGSHRNGGARGRQLALL